MKNIAFLTLCFTLCTLTAQDPAPEDQTENLHALMHLIVAREADTPDTFVTILQVVLDNRDPAIDIVAVWIELVDETNGCVYARKQVNLKKGADTLQISAIFPGAHEEVTPNLIIETLHETTSQRARHSTGRPCTELELKPETALPDIDVPKKDETRKPRGFQPIEPPSKISSVSA